MTSMYNLAELAAVVIGVCKKNWRKSEFDERVTVIIKISPFLSKALQRKESFDKTCELIFFSRCFKCDIWSIYFFNLSKCNHEKV